MTIANISGTNFCPLIEDLGGAAATAAVSDPGLPEYVPEYHGMDCKDRLFIAYGNINACPEAKKLLKAVQAMGKVFWKCVPTYLAPFGTVFDAKRRTIMFANENVREVPGVSAFLFELKNAEQAPKLLEVMNKAAKGLIDKYEFVYELESLEYLSSKRLHEIATACQRSSQWPSSIADTYDQPKDLTFFFSEQEIEHWMKTSKVAAYVKPSDSPIQINNFILQESAGHSEHLARKFDWIRANYEIILK